MRKANITKSAYLTMEHSKETCCFREACVHALCALTALELLLHGMLFLLDSEFTGWTLSLQRYLVLQMMLIASTFLFECLIPSCKEYKKVCQVALEIGYPLVFALIAWTKKDVLVSSGKMLFNDYLLYFNRQFGTVYESYPQQSATKEPMLSFLIVVVFLLCLMLRYVSNIRMFLLLPDLLVLFAGLLVNALPQWQGLSSFFVGVLLLFAAPGSSSSDMHAVAGKSRRTEKKGLALGQLFSFAVTAVSAMLLVSISGYAFSGVAKHIPEKRPQFYAFQQKIEEGVQKRVNQLSVLGITFQKDRAHVDNETPEYSGETVLQIEMSEKSLNNLYLKSFDSGTYRNNTWVDDDKTFQKAAKKQGYDSEHIGMLLQQQVYEMLQAQSSVSSAEYLDALASSYMTAKVEPVSFQVDYKMKHLPDALFPYYSDLSDAPKDLWVEGDSLIRKKRSTEELEGTFINADADLTLDVYSIGRSIKGTQKAKAYQWYSDYVLQQYRNEKTQVPSIARVLKKNRQSFEVFMYDPENYREGEGFFVDQMVKDQMGEWKSLYGEELDEEEQERVAINHCRSELARWVKDFLADTASYNLYLNPVPKGTNTIDYFLETGHEGYCMHFATAGALLLQELGVPARYASGYVVKECDFHDKKGTYVAEIPDYNAHAWVEIYMERIGWIPIEMTPGYDESIAKIPTDPGLRESLKEKHRRQTQEPDTETKQEVSGETERPTETQTQEETQTTETSGEKTPQETGGGRVDQMSVLLIAAAFLLVLAIAVFVILQWRAYHQRLLRELRQKKNRQALQRMNRRIYHGLRGSAFGIKSDVQYLEKLKNAYPAILEDAWERYLAIVQKAVFSTEPVTEEETRFCYKIYRKTRRRTLRK